MCIRDSACSLTPHLSIRYVSSFVARLLALYPAKRISRGSRMNPAFSVIFLTTLIGVGQGLFLALFTQQSYALFDLLPHQDARFYGWGSLLALVFTMTGLIASFLHLGRPGRAWRAAAQWRTSWLSREVIVLPAFMVILLSLIHISEPT